MTTPLERLFARLPGAWTVARSIEDTRLGSGRFDGLAVFAPQSEGALLYEEKGELNIGAWHGPAYRRWLYAREADGLSIFHPDGRTLLHRFSFEADDMRAEHTHLCGEDRYRAVLNLTEQGGFTLNYAVEGPAKQYVLNTVYTPALGTGNEVTSETLIPRARPESFNDGYPL